MFANSNLASPTRPIKNEIIRYRRNNVSHFLTSLFAGSFPFKFHFQTDKPNLLISRSGALQTVTAFSPEEVSGLNQIPMNFFGCTYKELVQWHSSWVLLNRFQLSSQKAVWKSPPYDVYLQPEVESKAFSLGSSPKPSQGRQIWASPSHSAKWERAIRVWPPISTPFHSTPNPNIHDSTILTCEKKEQA